MPKMNPTAAETGADERVELSDEWAVDPQPPAKLSLFGKPYDIRRDFTGKEVLEFSKLLRATPELGDDGKVKPDAVEKMWEERFAFLLTAGNPYQLAVDIAEQNTGVAERLINRIYGTAGLLTAEGKFMAL